jgi:hypothetical protein
MHITRQNTHCIDKYFENDIHVYIILIKGSFACIIIGFTIHKTSYLIVAQHISCMCLYIILFVFGVF